jgi:hypothetical protein
MSLTAHHRPLFLALYLLAGLAPAQESGALPKDRAEGAKQIAVPQMQKWLGTLASEEFGGRGTGQPGFQKAADMVAAHFKELGLQPRGDDGTYFQNVPWSAPKIDKEHTSVAFQKDGKEVLRIPVDRLAGNASGAVDATGPVALLVVPEPARAERGQTPAIEGLDAVDVEGKVVVVHIVNDGTETQNQSAYARLGVLRALDGKKAAAIVFAQRDAVEGGMQSRGGATRRAGNPAIAGMRLSPANIAIGGDDLTALLAAAGTDAAVLAGKEIAPATAALTATVQVKVQDDKVPAMNVVGVLPGSDPKLKDEYVVIGSHLDHLGRRGDSYFPGADDDGSGSTGVLAVSAAFAKNPVRCKRSILFVTFCGEESGLIGSGYFVDHCPIPLSSIVGELQMDMIGRDKEENREGGKGEKAENNRNTLHLIGSQKLSNDLHKICMSKNDTAKFDLKWDQEGMFSRSDHANFAKMGVPIAFFFTGLHRDYHQTTDTPDKINFPKLARVATYVYDIGFELAQQHDRPLIDKELWEQNRKGLRGAETPAAPLRKK